MELFRLFGTIAVNGADKVANEIEEVATQSEKAADEMGETAKSSKTLGNETKSLSEKYEKAKDNVKQLKDEYEKVCKEQGENSDSAKKLAKQIDEATKETDEFEKELKKLKETGSETEQTMARAGGNIGKAFSTMAKVGIAAVGAAATAIGALTKQSIESYASYEQLVGGVETLFGAGGKSLNEYAASVGKSVSEASAEYGLLEQAQRDVMTNASKAYETAGLSANAYMETVTSFSGSLLQSVGGDTVKAASIADRAIRDMSDNANKMGTDMGSIQNAYQGFSKQNYTMLDNLKLGYGGTKAEMERLIADANELRKAQGLNADLTIDSYADVVEAIHTVQVEMGIYETTANEAATTIEGSTKMTKAAWANLLTGLADDTQDFDALMSIFVNSAVTMFNNILPRIQTVFNAIPQLIQGIAPQIPAIVGSLLPALVEAAVGLVNGLVMALPEILSALLAVIPVLLQGLDRIATTLLAALPEIVSLLVGFISNPNTITMILNAAFSMFSGFMQAIPLILTSLAEALPDIILTVVAFLSDPSHFQTILNATLAALMAIVNAIPQIATALIEAAPMIILALVNFLTSPNTIQFLIEGTIQLMMAMIEAIPVIVAAFVENAPKIIEGIITGLMNAVPALLQAIGNIGKGLLDKFLGVFGIEIGGGSSAESERIGASVAQGFENGIASMPSDADAVFSQVGTNITNNMDSTRSRVETDSSAISDAMIRAGQSANTGFSEGFSEIDAAATGSLTDTSATVTSKTMEINNTLNSQLSTAEALAETKFEGIRQTVSDKMAEITKTAQDAINKIVSAFNIDLKFRSVIVPDFRIEGRFDTELGKTPTIKADPKKIYFAEGGIVDKATVFGMYGNNPMVAGERGKEAIAPIDTLQGYVAEAVASQNNGLLERLDRILNAILNMDENMGGNMRDALDGTALSINNREFGRLVKGVI